MAAALKLTHKAIGVEVRRGTYDIVLDGSRVGSVEMNGTFEMSMMPGRHTLQVRAFRCTGKSVLPVFLASFVVPGLALSLVRQ